MSSAPRSTPRSTQASLGQIILGFEMVVMGLAALVAMGLGAVEAPVALAGGGALVLFIIVTIALIARYKWAFALGWVVQAAIVASGFVLQMMFILGIVFTAMWTYGMVKGAQLDAQKANNS